MLEGFLLKIVMGLLWGAIGSIGAWLIMRRKISNSNKKIQVKVNSLKSVIEEETARPGKLTKPGRQRIIDAHKALSHS